MCNIGSFVKFMQILKSKILGTFANCCFPSPAKLFSEKKFRLRTNKIYTINYFFHLKF